MSRSTVVIELAGGAPFARDLAAGGVFVPACALRLAEECDLVVLGSTHQLRIPARVVYVDPRGGAGLELLGFSPEMKAQLAELATVGDDDGDDDGDDNDDLAIPRDAGDDAADAWQAGADDGSDEPAPEDLAIPISAEDDAERGRFDDAPGSGQTAPPRITTEPGPERAFAPARAAARVTGVKAVPVVAALEAELDAALELAQSGTPDPAAPDAPAPDADTEATELDAELDFADAEPELDDQAGRVAGGYVHDDEWLVAGGADDAWLAAGDGADPEAAEDLDDGDDAERAQGELADDASGAPAGTRRRFARNVHERLRALTLAAQIKLATQGELHERIVLERLYGKNVWETLLRNPRLTAPEVSRIARYGSLPRVLLEIIVGNNAWLQIPEVRRALLSNPRLGVDQIMKVLRLTPKHELKLAAIQTAYPHAVRNAAKQLMRGDPER